MVVCACWLSGLVAGGPGGGAHTILKLVFVAHPVVGFKRSRASGWCTLHTYPFPPHTHKYSVCMHTKTPCTADGHHCGACPLHTRSTVVFVIAHHAVTLPRALCTFTQAYVVSKHMRSSCCHCSCLAQVRAVLEPARCSRHTANKPCNFATLWLVG